MSIMSSCVVDPQILLSHALSKNNIRDFCMALDMGADPCLFDNDTNVYEKALSTYGCSHFIKECLEWGCSPYYINHLTNKGAINFAADSCDPQIIDLLLKSKDIQVDRKYSQLSPINSLAKNLNANNISDVTICIKLLLQYGACPNTIDQKEMTPLHYVLKNRIINDKDKKKIIQMFLEFTDLDIDTYRDGEVRCILTKEFSDLCLPNESCNQSVNAETLLSLIRSGYMKKFHQYLNKYQLNLRNKNNLGNQNKEFYMTLLIESIKRGTNLAFDTLMNNINEIDINAICQGITLIEVAAIWGNWYVIQNLLQYSHLKIQYRRNPLIIIIKKLCEEPKLEYCDYRKCFFLLLQSEKIQINIPDDSGQTALHYAVKYRNHEAIKELLKRGAYIGTKSAFNELPIDGINAELLQEHFNNCLTSNGLKLGDDNFEIHVNYMNLLPENYDKKLSGITSYSSQQLRQEMAPIEFIAKSKEYRHLLLHPLIASFLFLKWHRLSIIFYVNFISYVFFSISIISNTILNFRENEHTILIGIFDVLSWIGIAYVIIREIIQLIISPINYCRSITNYMEILLIVLSIVTCIKNNYDSDTRRVVAVFNIILISIELCLLVGSLPILSLSTHMLMLDTVCRSFLKSFTLYSIFVITFSLCFYILFGNPELTSSDDNFNKFSNPLSAIIKTIVMLTGEFDAGDIEFNSLYSYLLFLLFVFLMTIVLFNLLNGLAVNDTQIIKGQAELNGAICRTNVLSHYEKVFTGYFKKSIFLLNNERFRNICQKHLNLYPNYLNGRQIIILPNVNNTILVPLINDIALRTLNSSRTIFFPIKKNEDEILQKPLRLPIPFLSHYFKCSQMDYQTVKLALTIIERNKPFLSTQNSQQIIEKRLKNIDIKLEEITKILKDLQLIFIKDAQNITN